MTNRRKRKSNTKAKIVIASVLVLIEFAIFMSGYFVGVCTTKKNTVNSNVITQSNVQESGESEEEKLVGEIMKDMSISDMIYQMMFVTPEEITNIGTVVRAGGATKKALESYPIGGIVYFAQNFEDREQTIEMISKTQEYSKIVPSQ